MVLAGALQMLNAAAYAKLFGPMDDRSQVVQEALRAPEEAAQRPDEKVLQSAEHQPPGT
jgi:hypothetical protein